MAANLVVSVGSADARRSIFEGLLLVVPGDLQPGGCPGIDDQVVFLFFSGGDFFVGDLLELEGVLRAGKDGIDGPD